MKQTKSFWRDFRSYVIVTISLFFFSLGWTGFLIPNHMLGGGVNGIATIIYWLTGISTGVMIFALNGILILLSIKSLGWKFSIRTIYSIVVMSIFFSVHYLSPRILPALKSVRLTPVCNHCTTCAGKCPHFFLCFIQLHSALYSG